MADNTPRYPTVQRSIGIEEGDHDEGEMDRETIIKDGREIKQIDALKAIEDASVNDFLEKTTEENDMMNDKQIASPTTSHEQELDESVTKTGEFKNKRLRKKIIKKINIANAEEDGPIPSIIIKTTTNSGGPSTPTGTLKILGNGGLKTSSLPLVLNMARGNSTIGGMSLLPAGLPPGRYVILPSSTTSVPSITSISTTVTQAKIKTSVTATAADMKQTSGSSITSASTSVHQKTNYFSGRVGRPTKSALQIPSLLRRGNYNINYNRPVRGRRKSYTAAEKLAMIEAVEAGEKKSVVADHFGVAPSTLACILLQKHKIHSDQISDLSRRRLRHPRAASLSYFPSSQASPVTNESKETKDGTRAGEYSFGAHFLSSFSPSRQTIFDEEPPEEIISVPDLSDNGPLDGSNVGRHENVTSGYACSPLSAAGPSLGFQDIPKSFIPDYNHDMDQVDVKTEPLYETKMEVEDETPAANAGASTESSPSSRQPSPSPSGMTGPYLLKKETHCHNILDELLKDETYADVTLTAEGQTIKAHRIILSLSSKYFQNVLSPEPNAKNILLFRDMKFQELKNIINFIYTGEVTVDATDLDSFMKTADILEVTSLCNSQTKFPKGFKLGNYSSETESKQSQSKRPNSNSQSSPPAKVRKTSNEGVKQTKKSILSTSTSELKTKKSTIATPSSFRDLVSIASDSDTPKFKEEIIEEEEEAVEPNILQAECILSDNENDPGDINAMQSSCISCSSKFDTIDLMFQHLERDHENDELFPCEVCIQIFASSSAFDRHKINCKSKSSHLRVT